MIYHFCFAYFLAVKSGLSCRCVLRKVERLQLNNCYLEPGIHELPDVTRG